MINFCDWMTRGSQFTTEIEFIKQTTEDMMDCQDLRSLLAAKMPMGIQVSSYPSEFPCHLIPIGISRQKKIKYLFEYLDPNLLIGQFGFFMNSPEGRFCRSGNKEGDDEEEESDRFSRNHIPTVIAQSCCARPINKSSQTLFQ